MKASKGDVDSPSTHANRKCLPAPAMYAFGQPANRRTSVFEARACRCYVASHDKYGGQGEEVGESMVRAHSAIAGQKYSTGENIRENLRLAGGFDEQRAKPRYLAGYNNMIRIFLVDAKRCSSPFVVLYIDRGEVAATAVLASSPKGVVVSSRAW